MAEEYVLTAEADDEGVRFVHQAECVVAPIDAAADALGSFEECEAALAKARETAEKVDGCAMCCPSCHTTSSGT